MVSTPDITACGSMGSCVTQHNEEARYLHWGGPRCGITTAILFGVMRSRTLWLRVQASTTNFEGINPLTMRWRPRHVRFWQKRHLYFTSTNSSFCMEDVPRRIAAT